MSTDTRQPPAPDQRDRLLRLPAVENMTGIRKSSIYALVREARFPEPIRLTPRCSVWPESRVQEWIRSRIQAAGEK